MIPDTNQMDALEARNGQPSSCGILDVTYQVRKIPPPIFAQLIPFGHTRIDLFFERFWAEGRALVAQRWNFQSRHGSNRMFICISHLVAEGKTHYLPT